MFARLLVVGVTWLTALFLFAVLLQWSGSAPSQLSPSRDGVTSLARSLNVLRPVQPRGGYSWTVTAARSALRELVVEVDALKPDEAPGIAEHLVASVRTQYDEVLVYVRAHDPLRDPLVRRIEWTPRRGYLASTF